MMLKYIFVAVQYHDQYVKCQAWDREFVRLTSRLVFDPNLMDDDEQRAFNRTKRNWRLNPCMARYRNDDKPAELICQRVEDSSGRRRRKRGEKPDPNRGWPIGIEFHLSDGSSYYFEEDWIKKTGALKFRPDPAGYGAFEITHVSIDGKETDLNVAAAGTSGTKFSTIMPDDDCACWYGSGTRARPA